MHRVWNWIYKKIINFVKTILSSSDLINNIITFHLKLPSFCCYILSNVLCIISDSNFVFSLVGRSYVGICFYVYYNIILPMGIKYVMMTYFFLFSQYFINFLYVIYSLGTILYLFYLLSIKCFAKFDLSFIQLFYHV